MKRYFLFFSILTLLTACSLDPTVQAKPTDQSENVNQKKMDNKQHVYVPNPQVTDDRVLQKVGESYIDEKGEASLKAIKNVNQTYDIGPIQLTIKDVKVIHLIPDYSLIDYFHGLTHDEQFDFVKVSVEIKNTADETINFSPIALLETNTGEQNSWEEDIYLEGLNGEIEASGQKQGNLGFILKEPNGENLQEITILTSDVVNKQKKVISKANEIKINF